MTTKIVVLTTEGGSREDGNVYYARYLIVSSDTLPFNEKVFTDDSIRVSDIDNIEIDDNPEYVDQDKLIAHIKALGYTVDEPDQHIVTTACL